MRKITFVMLSLLFSFLTTNLFAHALWIETAASGKVGQKQTVKVYYGEYAENERDSVAKWYSDVKEFTLWLVGPDQKKIQLSVTPGVNFFEGSFTPSQNGAYTLAVSHEAKDLGGTTKYHFLASANVAVGKNAAIVIKNTNVLQLYLEDVQTAKANKAIKLKTFYNDAAAAGKTVSVFSPMGWSKEIKTDENGIAEFTPLWPGRYVVEVSDMDKKATGNHNGKDYTAVWKGATYSFEIK